MFLWFYWNDRYLDLGTPEIHNAVKLADQLDILDDADSVEASYSMHYQNASTMPVDWLPNPM